VSSCEGGKKEIGFESSALSGLVWVMILAMVIVDHGEVKARRRGSTLNFAPWSSPTANSEETFSDRNNAVVERGRTGMARKRRAAAGRRVREIREAMAIIV
jgi:hypothetical protein